MEQDELYDKAVMVVQAHNRALISTLQRYLQIGYNRATRLIEAMEADGIVSPLNEKGYRVVLKPRAANPTTENPA